MGDYSVDYLYWQYHMKLTPEVLCFYFCTVVVVEYDAPDSWAQGYV